MKKKMVCALLSAAMVSTMLVGCGGGSGETATETTETTFADDASISSWAKNGVAFANSMGYVKGKGDNLFDPDGDATRAELAQIFFNMFK